VAKKRNSDESRLAETAASVALQLPPERAFVLHLDVRARPPRHMLARIEHITSGRIARISSLRELTTFLGDVLRDGNRREGDAKRFNRTTPCLQSCPDVRARAVTEPSPMAAYRQTDIHAPPPRDRLDSSAIRVPPVEIKHKRSQS